MSCNSCLIMIHFWLAVGGWCKRTHGATGGWKVSTGGRHAPQLFVCLDLGWCGKRASLTSLSVSEDQRVSPSTCNLNHSGLQRLDERQGHRRRLQHVVVALIYTNRARRHMNKKQWYSLNNININLLEKHCEMECDTWKKHTLRTYPRANTRRPLLSSIP